MAVSRIWIARGVRSSLLGVLTLALPARMAIAFDLEYSVDAGIERNDNVTLSTTDPIRQDILRGGTSFALVHDGPAVQASAVGRVEFGRYEDARFDDRLDGTFTGRLDWMMVPERLAITAEDQLSRQPVDTLAADVPGNRQQINVLSVGPTLFFRLTPSFHGQVELRHTVSDAEVTTEFNSRRWTLAAAGRQELDPVSGIAINTVVQRVDFDIAGASARDYDRLDVFARYTRTLRSFDLGLDLGHSVVEYRDDGSRRNDPLFRLDVVWRQSERSAYTLELSQQFTDVAAEAMGAVEPGQPVPGSIPTGTAVINASPYEERNASVEYAFTGIRTTLALRPYASRLDYIESDAFDQDGHGVEVFASRLLNPRLTLGAYAAFREIDYRQLDRRDETRRAGVHLQYRWSRLWSTRLDWARYERASTATGEDATQNTLYLSMIYTSR